MAEAQGFWDEGDIWQQLGPRSTNDETLSADKG